MADLDFFTLKYKQADRELKVGGRGPRCRPPPVSRRRGPQVPGAAAGTLHVSWQLQPLMGGLRVSQYHQLQDGISPVPLCWRSSSPPCSASSTFSSSLSKCDGPGHQGRRVPEALPRLLVAPVVPGTETA